MKFRYLSIFLILLILSVGAVNAQEDAASDDSISIVQDDVVLSTAEYVIDDSNYENYFNSSSGVILENSNISDGDTIKLGNITNKDFVIDKSLSFTSNSSDDILINVSFKFVTGSDGSIIENLNFISVDAQGATISIENATGIFISENEIDVVGAEGSDDFYVIYADLADNLNVQANVVSYTGKTDGTAINNAVYVSNSEDVVFEDNVFEIEIPGGDLDWTTGFGSTEGIVFDTCDNLAFYENNITLVTDESVGYYPTVYAVHIGGSDNVVVEFNKIEALSEIDYLYGLKVDGDNFVVSENIIHVASEKNYACGVEIGTPANGVVDANNISVISPITAYGVYAADWYGSGCSVNITNNVIEGLTNTFFGVSLYGVNETVIEGNSIEAYGNYTTGIASNANILTVNNNTFELKGSGEGDPLGYDSLGVANVAVNSNGGTVTISSNTINSADNGIIVKGGIAEIAVNIIDVEDNGLSDSYAIYVNDTLAIVSGNTISYSGKTNGSNKNAAIYVVDSEIEVSDNEINANLTSAPVDWVAVGYDYIPNAFAQGLYFSESDVELTGNKIVVGYSNFTGSMDTIYAVNVYACDDSFIEGNIIEGTGYTYIYGLIIRGDNFTVSTNEITMVSDNNYANGIDVESDSTGIVNDNFIFVTSPYVAYGIYAAMNWAGDWPTVDYTGNEVHGYSHAVYGMNLYGTESVIENNAVNLNGNYTMGISTYTMDDVATIINNEIMVKGLKNDTEDVGDMLPAQTVGILTMSESQIHNNKITSLGNYTIVNSDEYSEITENYLVSSELLGDNSVDDRSGDAIVEDNIPITGATNYNLTNDTFFLFFTEYGMLRENITSESLTFIGEFSDVANWLNIDRPITLLGDNATLYDMSFSINSYDVAIDGFNFISEDLSSIIDLIYVDNVQITNNNFTVVGVNDDNNHVIGVYGSNNALIENNTIIFGADINGTYENAVITAVDSDNLVLAGNTITALLPARSINWTSGDVYSIGVDLENCDNAVLDSNSIGIKSNDQTGPYDTIYAVRIAGDNATVSGNEIGVVEAPYGYALVVSGEYFLIEDNMIFAGENQSYACGIEVDGPSNGEISDNIIAVVGDSAYGIYTANWAGDVKVAIADNAIFADANSAFGMSLSGSEALVADNAIIMKGNFTTGIASAVDSIIIDSNNISANGSNVGTPLGYDMMGIETTGIHIVSGEALITNNTITTTGEYAVDMEGTGNVTDNELYAEVYTGDASVDYDSEKAIVANNIPTMYMPVLTAEDVVMYYKNGTRYVVKLTDKQGNVLTNQTVVISINGRSYNKITDANGTVSIGLNLNSGNYTISASYTGVDFFANATIQNNITILTTVFGDDLVKVFKNASQYHATFVDGQGNALVNTNVTFNINGVMYHKVTNENGTATLNINLAQGKYIITAISSYNGEMHANNVTVLSAIVNNTDIKLYYKNGTKYQVTIVGADGKHVGAGENVTFNINGVFYKRTTDENGIASLNINLQPANYTVTAEYNGCKVSNNVEVLPVLFANDLHIKYGTSDQFRAFLLDGLGNPYPGQNITFNINGRFYVKTTDADGYAALTIRLGASINTYIITSSYNGTNVANQIVIEP